MGTCSEEEGAATVRPPAKAPPAAAPHACAVAGQSLPS